MQMIESVVTTLARILEAQLPVKLAAIEAEFADGIVLVPPAKIVTYEPAVQEVPERPLLMILPGRSVALNDTGLGGGGWADYTHSVLVALMLEEPDPYTLSRQLLRSQNALVQVIGANRTGILDSDGDSAWAGISIEGTDPGERFQLNSGMNPYVQVTMVSVKATRTEA